jgi:hypothetical protein
VDAFRSVHVGEDFDEFDEFRPSWLPVGEQKGSEVVPECAAGAYTAAMTLAFRAAPFAVQIGGDSCAAAAELPIAVAARE